MAHANKDTVLSASKAEDQRRMKAAELEKAEQERQEKWVTRSDVVYHFFAYRYFDRSSNCLDLINFSDADVDSFNLTANKTRGLDNWHVCAAYLKKLETPTPKTTTQRRKFIHHVRSFNKTQPSHFRFYLRNLTADDLQYVEGLCKAEKGAVVGEITKETELIWATSCVEDEVLDGTQLEGLTAADGMDHVEVALQDCLAEHRLKRKENIKENAETAQEHDDNVDTIRDEMTKKFEQMTGTGGKISVHKDNKPTADYFMERN